MTQNENCCRGYRSCRAKREHSYFAPTNRDRCDRVWVEQAVAEPVHPVTAAQDVGLCGNGAAGGARISTHRSTTH